MSLFFHFEVIWRSYASFLVLTFSTLWAQIVKSSCARAGSSLWPSELKFFVVISIDHGNEKNCLANFSSIFFTFWTPLLITQSITCTDVGIYLILRKKDTGGCHVLHPTYIGECGDGINSSITHRLCSLGLSHQSLAGGNGQEHWKAFQTTWSWHK